MIEIALVVVSLADVARIYVEAYILNQSDLDYAYHIIEMARGQLSHSILEIICNKI